MVHSERTQPWVDGAVRYESTAASPLTGLTRFEGRRRPRPSEATRLGPAYELIASDLLVIWDAAMMPVTAALSLFVWHVVALGTPPALGWLQMHLSLPIVGGLIAPLVLYDGPGERDRPRKGAFGTTLRVVALFALVLAIGVCTGVVGAIPIIGVGLWVASAIAAALGGRALLARHLRSLRRRRVLSERVAIIGGGVAAERLRADLHRTRDGAVVVAGIFDDALPSSRGFGRIDGTVEELIELGKTWPLDSVLVATPPPREDESAALLRRLMSLDADIMVPQHAAAAAAAPMCDRRLAPRYVPLARRPIRGWGIVLKSLEDKVLAAALLLLTAPLIALCALFVRMESPGPIIFRQRRHGRNNAEFEVLKLRTMAWQGEEASAGAAQTRRDDPRVTRVGHFLRRTSLDELPQLINVLKGEMSIVGPRPHPVAMRTQGRLCSEIVPEYAHRHRVRPGLTGLAQVNGCRGAAELPEQVRRRVQYDLAYIENWSLLSDLKIIALTPWRLLTHRSSAF